MATLMNKVTPLRERFERGYMPVTESGCWLWLKACRTNGYGVIGLGSRTAGLQSAHIVSWELHKGPVPEGLCVLHKCDVRSCVNPDHLWLGTYTDNNRDMAKKGRHWCQSRTHCKHGHPLTRRNKKQRYCRICKNAADLQSYYRNKEKQHV